MYRLIMALTVATILFLIYQQFDSHQQQKLQQEQALQAIKMEKAALDEAKASNNPAAIEQFIQDHPQSSYIETAHYHKDRLIVQQAAKNEDEKALQQFVQQNPDSDWREYAQQYIKRFQRIRANEAITKAAIAEKNEQPVAPEAGAQSKPVSRYASTAKKQSSDAEDARDRVNRALSIYGKINEKKQTESERKQRIAQQQQERNKKCNTIQDQLISFKKPTRWYQLDEQGKRVYMDKNEVQNTRSSLQQQYDKNCR